MEKLCTVCGLHLDEETGYFTEKNGRRLLTRRKCRYCLSEARNPQENKDYLKSVMPVLRSYPDKYLDYLRSLRLIFGMTTED
jgi:hypothetical protein